jgi:TonB-dependent SusC/RagA subfamily outer membrane receptor
MKLRFILLVFILSVSGFAVSMAQKPVKRITISGLVIDSNFKPLAGAFILIDNKKTEITTDSKGFYKIRVKPTASLIAVFTMSNGVKEEQINGRSEINFTFSASGKPLNLDGKGQDEKYDIGYGTIKKADMTTAGYKIDGQNKKYASYQNIYDMIRGEFPGVQVYGKSIVIQGPSSINLSSEPLYVVDGMAVTTIDDIRPQQVKTIQVLKGPSASIYGSRGATGVILIELIGAEKKK